VETFVNNNLSSIGSEQIIVVFDKDVNAFINMEVEDNFLTSENPMLMRETVHKFAKLKLNLEVIAHLEGLAT